MIAAILCSAIHGAAIGVATTAVMTKLLIVPRILQVFGLGHTKARHCAVLVSAGVICAATIDAMQIPIGLGSAGTLFAGLMCGVYAGLLAMAAVEVLDIVPFLATGRGLKGAMKYLLAAAIAGKTVGALAYFLDGRWIP